jgi:glycosyltransferase involved in cell wall biosynthesis
MIKPLITIVIPTRERADTLKFALATVLDQANDNFQVVVSDNFSQDNTKEVVEAFSDCRITYVNTGKRLSMCDNWDFAFKHVQGEFVIYIGDDDGLMPGAINRLEAMIKTRPSPIYYWEGHEYIWPIEENPPKIISITPVHRAYEIDLNRLVRFSLRWGGVREGRLPRVYHAAVSTSLLEAICKKTGRIFHSQCPDIFTVYALPAFSNEAVNMGVALTVRGYSGKSNSGKNIARNGVETIQRFIREYGNYQFHSSLFPGAPYIINSIQDSVLVAMDLFPEFYANIRFNYEAMWAHMLWSGRYERTLGTSENKLSSVFHLLYNRKKIRSYHSFRVTHFLFYCLINALLELRAVLKRKTRQRKIDEWVNDCPRNIQAFVQLVDMLNQKKS